MTKEILLSLKGLQIENPQEDGEEIETITPGEYYQRNGSHYVIYDEVTEGYSDTTKNIIKFKDSLVEVTKKGLMEFQVYFLY